MESIARSEVPQFTERREDARVAIALEVALTGDSQFFTGITGDIARGGLFVGTYRTLPIGRLVELTFSLPNGAVIHTSGRVRWSRDASTDTHPGIGVSFESLSDADRAQIETFCAEREPLYHDDGE